VREQRVAAALAGPPTRKACVRRAAAAGRARRPLPRLRAPVPAPSQHTHSTPTPRRPCGPSRTCGSVSAPAAAAFAALWARFPHVLPVNPVVIARRAAPGGRPPTFDPPAATLSARPAARWRSTPGAPSHNCLPDCLVHGGGIRLRIPTSLFPSLNLLFSKRWARLPGTLFLPALCCAGLPAHASWHSSLLCLSPSWT
jgi:hypothetical protein